MKALVLVLVLLLATIASAQQPFFSVGADESLVDISIADFNGNKQRELCFRVQNWETAEDRLIFFDLERQTEIANYPITLRQSDYYLYPGDINGDNVTEAILINSIDTFRPEDNEPGFVVFQWQNGLLFRSAFTQYWGQWGQVGDVNGDGRDEIILYHLPMGYTNLGGTGPLEIQVLSKRGSNFNLISSVALPTMYLRSAVTDLDGDGRAEIITLKSGRKDPEGVPIPQQLAVYSYTGEPLLTLLDEVTVPTDYDDNMNLLWTQSVAGGGRRIIVPVPEKWEDHMDKMRILRYQGYRLERQQLVLEQEPLTFNWEYYDEAPLILPVSPSVIDVDSNGITKYVQIDDWKRLKLVRELPSVLPRR